MASYSVADLDELEGEGPGGAVRKVRRALGVEAFGCNYVRLPPNATGLEHDERESRQEEVLFVVRGSGVLRVDGEEIELGEGRFVRIDPAARRVPVSGPDGLEFLAIGAPRGAYTPPAWG